MKHDLYDYAHSTLRYDPETGALVSRVERHNCPPGKRRDLATSSGYRMVKLRKRRYYAHRVIWLMMTGEWPKHTIDHINRVKDDNRWCNLRDVTQAENNRNSPLPPPPKLHFLYRRLAGITSNLG